MTIDRPAASQIPQLRLLWQEAFADTDGFLDIFFHRAFAFDRCRCVTKDGRVVAALYWFDCRWQEKKLAYLYAVATAKDCRKQGLSRALIENTHESLRQAGYNGVILAPAKSELFALYSKFGYRTCSHIHGFTCTAAGEPIALMQVDPDAYAAARRRLLPQNSVLQEGVTLDFLSTYGWLYVGQNLALAAYPYDGNLVVCELLGDPQAAPQILKTLGFREGSFRVPGQQTPFTMYRSLTADETMPSYFGLILD